MAVFVRRKCFISYHHADELEVRQFINTFDTLHNLFIHRILGTMNDDIVNSTSTDYVMSRIRQEYLADSTVTIVPIGACTWARRYVDWEIQASLRSGSMTTPNGLLGVVLPSAASNPIAPERLRLNLANQDGSGGYARWIHYPSDAAWLASYIEDAYQRRTTHALLIKNPRERMGYNRQCP